MLVSWGVRTLALRAERGFTVGEVIVVLAVIGVVALVSAPTLFSYWRAATAKAAAEELAAGLNRGRQLAVMQNQNVCVEVVGIRYRYRLGGCTGAVWTGPETDANGLMSLANNVTLATDANPVFSNMGAAAPGATMTVTNLEGDVTLTVAVSGSGRVQIQ